MLAKHIISWEVDPLPFIEELARSKENANELRPFMSDFTLSSQRGKSKYTTPNAYLKTVQQRLIVVSSIEVPNDRVVPGSSETSQYFRVDSKTQLLHS